MRQPRLQLIQRAQPLCDRLTSALASSSPYSSEIFSNVISRQIPKDMGGSCFWHVNFIPQILCSYKTLKKHKILNYFLTYMM